MSRLYRPHIPYIVRCRVAVRQIGWGERSVDGQEKATEMLLRLHRPSNQPRFRGETGYERLLNNIMPELREKLGADPGEKLHLDHDPPLAARGRKGEGKNTVYDPPANDPRFLVYRTERKHKAKTNLRGEHGQHPDRVLIKKERRRRKRTSVSAAKIRRPKMKWAKRRLRSRNDLRRDRPRRDRLPLPERRR